MEGNEQFALNINNALLPNDVITDSSSRATVIIKDDDSKLSLQKYFKYIASLHYALNRSIIRNYMSRIIILKLFFML